MYKTLLKKSKGELVRIIFLLFGLVLALGLLSATGFISIEKEVTDISGGFVTGPTVAPSGTYTNCKGPNCGAELGNPDRTTAQEVVPSPVPNKSKCMKFGSWKICRPKM